ncbi:MAG TPA: poly-gamma-glutamate biosynthesis protein PgsC/CapC [Crinalium sp.]|jgi:hypothetical protein
MFTDFNTPEIDRLALVIGAGLSVAYQHKFGILPGGVIVPGLLVIVMFTSPIWGVTTLMLALLVYWIYQQFFAQQGFKRRTPMYIMGMISLALANLAAFIYVEMGWLTLSLDSLSSTLLPAIIAFNFVRQSIPKVAQGLAIVTCCTTLLLVLIYLCDSQWIADHTHPIQPLATEDVAEFKYHLVQCYIALIVGYAIYHFKQIRAGGYMIAPVVATIFLKPIEIGIFLLGCFSIYYLTRLISRFTLVIGLRRYLLVLWISTVFIWGSELLLAKVMPDMVLFRGSYVLVIIAMTSYVNDAILYSGKKVIYYMGLTVLISLTTLLSIKILSSALLGG